MADAYNFCGALSERALEHLSEKIKVFEASGSRRSIDSLATEYQRELDQLRQTALESHKTSTAASNKITSLEQFSSFVQLLESISTQRRQLISHAAQEAMHGDNEQICDDVWRALMRRLFDRHMSEWLDQWMTAALSCVVHMLNDKQTLRSVRDAQGVGVDSDVIAHLVQYQKATGLPVLVACAGASDGDADDVGDSEDEVKHRLLYSSLMAGGSGSGDGDGGRRGIGRFIVAFAKGCRLLEEVQLLRYAGETVKCAIARVVQDSVEAEAGSWEGPRLRQLQIRLGMATSTLDALIQQSCRGGSSASYGYAQKLLLERFCELRTAELFSIIVDYPETMAAIEDLGLCVSGLNNMDRVAQSLRAAVQKRLLHPGATTQDILTQYISSIRCLRVLDPSSTVLEIVARPIRSYLRSREDTVMCVVQDMVSEQSELFEEDPETNSSVILDNGPEGVFYDEDYLDRAWQPLPVEAQATYLTAQRRDADVLSLLVSIYDSKDVFVQEFETHLTQQLLQRTDYNAVREVRQVEMMKMRFGDRAMERCEVMLKDVAESKRTDQLISETGREKHWDLALHSMVVSRQFWAGLGGLEPVCLPRPMAEMQNKYAGVFESLRPARKLEWRDGLGSVTLEIELQDRVVHAQATVTQAATLFAMQEATGSGGAVEPGTLAGALECPEETVLAYLRFWQTKGVVREASSGLYEVAETLSDVDGTPGDENAHGDSVHEMSDAEGDSGSESGDPSAADGQRTEALRMHFNYIVGMLTNIGPLPLDRIHSMLGMFVPGDTTTADELRSFLALMVREDRLELVGGAYRLKQ
ncbi:Anaphase-promoting complex subunit 2 [Coemansia sp. Benny D115]|nr:Anaphase-promoting complex subunit 2 [Coemansia sp. Benny D115]